MQKILLQPHGSPSGFFLSKHSNFLKVVSYNFPIQGSEVVLSGEKSLTRETKYYIFRLVFCEVKNEQTEN